MTPGDEQGVLRFLHRHHQPGIDHITGIEPF